MRNLRSSESKDLGKRLLDQSLKDIGSSLRKVGKIRIAEAIDSFGLNNKTELFEQIGLGERLAPITARFLTGTKDENHQISTSLTISGTEGMVISYGKCCYPIPGDEVMGYLTAGKGIVIHRNQCGNLSNFRKQPEKWLAVDWEKKITKNFLCQIQTDTKNKPGVLAEVAAIIGDCNSNIEQVEVLGRHDDCSVISFLLLVRDRVHLANIMRNVRKMKNVIRISRECK